MAVFRWQRKAPGIKKHQHFSESNEKYWCWEKNNGITNENCSSPTLLGETPTNLVRSPIY